MIFHYENVKKIAEKLGYSSFTPLQEQAFLNPDIYCLKNDFFILGETSSGKTLIPILRYYLQLKKAQEEQLPLPKMLFVVPYRALAAQKLKEFQRFFRGESLQIVQSTGEFRQDDVRIQQGKVDVAVIIAEKVYRFASRDESFLSQYDLMVVDEIGLINSADRGGRIDFLLLWAREQKNKTGCPGITALGTPFFNWEAYVKSYGFQLVTTKSRPVELKEHTIAYSPQGISAIDGLESEDIGIPQIYRKRFLTRKMVENFPKEDGFKTECKIHPDGMCSVELACRHHKDKICSISGRPCLNQIRYVEKISGSMVSMHILTEVCKWHLSLGHQILIFQNDREQVRGLCLKLSQSLKEVLPPPQENAKKEIIQSCDLDAEDLTGIMESEHYQAFSQGIAFHSAAMPNELRTYVENNILETKNLKIVCCTETLAFGVNSSVDVVIIASMVKPDNGGQRFLTLNEYKNYVGRAGRLRKNVDEQKSIGYVYTLIGTKNRQQTGLWRELQQSEQSMVTLYSHFYDVFDSEHNNMPFYILNMLPLDDKISLENLNLMIQILPCPDDYDKQKLNKELHRAIDFLIEEKLIVRSAQKKIPLREKGRVKQKTENRYELTMFGQQLRGYIISTYDYQKIKQALEIAINGSTLNRADFLYYLLQTKQLENELRGAFRNAEEKLNKQQILEYFAANQHGLSEQYLRELKQTNSEEQIRIYYVLGALLGWCEGMPAGELYRKFGVLYPLLQKSAEQIGYLIEISREIVPAILEENFLRWQKLGLSFDFEIHDKELEQQVEDFFISIYYGINMDVYHTFLLFLNQQPELEAQQLAEEFSLERMEPKLARKIRRIVVRYRFFHRPVPVFAADDKESRNNYKDQFNRYRDDIRKMNPPYVERFFEHSFPERFSCMI